jgi:ADP-heptose:LPS heptosyltransferase
LSKRILIVRLSAIGDVIQSTPVARQLKLQHPDWHVAWVVERKALAGIAHNPRVDETIVMDTKRPASWREMWGRLRGRYDITLDLQCLLKAGLVTWIAGSPLRIGRDDAREGSGVFYNRRMPTRWDHTYISQHYLEQGADLGLDPSDYVPELFLAEEDHAAAERLWAEVGLGAPGVAVGALTRARPAAQTTSRSGERSYRNHAPVVALIAFSAEPTREWLTERFAQVGDALTEQHGARCVIFGSRAEMPRAEALAAQMRSEPIILAGKTSLGSAAAFLQRCDLALGADTGLTHYAFALGTPLICLLGPSPLRNGPKSDTAVSLWSECPHRPCRPSDRCRRGEGRPCLAEITVEQVLEAAARLLEASPP